MTPADAARAVLEAQDKATAGKIKIAFGMGAHPLAGCYTEPNELGGSAVIFNHCNGLKESDAAFIVACCNLAPILAQRVLSQAADAPPQPSTKDDPPDEIGHSAARRVGTMPNKAPVLVTQTEWDEMSHEDQKAVLEELNDMTCRGCNKPLLPENSWMEDGCPCNTPRCVNDGLICPKCNEIRNDASCACKTNAAGELLRPPLTPAEADSYALGYADGRDDAAKPEKPVVPKPVGGPFKSVEEMEEWARSYIPPEDDASSAPDARTPTPPQSATSDEAKLRKAIHDAGFSIMITSGDWSLHDTSERGKAEEARSLEVATRNVDLELRVQELEAGLQPFAEWAAEADSCQAREVPDEATATFGKRPITFGDCRRARALLSGEKGQT